MSKKRQHHDAVPVHVLEAHPFCYVVALGRGMGRYITAKGTDRPLGFKTVDAALKFLRQTKLQGASVWSMDGAGFRKINGILEGEQP